jgi:hypothetical protein
LIFDAVAVVASAALNDVVATQEVWPSAEQSKGVGTKEPATPAKVIPVFMFAAVARVEFAALKAAVATQDV